MLVMLSCSDDSTSPSEETAKIPETNITIIATLEGGKSDTTQVMKRGKDDSYSPKGFLISGNYTTS